MHRVAGGDVPYRRANSHDYVVVIRRKYNQRLLTKQLQRVGRGEGLRGVAGEGDWASL